MTHPFERIAPGSRRRVFFAMFIATLVVMAGLLVVDASLHTEPTPQGIVSFEICAFGDRCADAVRAYQPVRLEAGASLGLDYLYMPLYACTIGAGLVFLAARRSARVRAIAAWLAWAIFLAASLDAIENVALYVMLARGATPLWGWIAALCATPKLIIVVVDLLALPIIALLPRSAPGQ